MKEKKADKARGGWEDRTCVLARGRGCYLFIFSGWRCTHDTVTRKLDLLAVAANTAAVRQVLAECDKHLDGAAQPAAQPAEQ